MIIYLIIFSRFYSFIFLFKDILKFKIIVLYLLVHQLNLLSYIINNLNQLLNIKDLSHFNLKNLFKNLTNYIMEKMY